MCGNHVIDQPELGPSPTGPIGRVPRRVLHRRAFLGQFGRGTAALALLGPVAVACSSSSSPQSATTSTAAASQTTSGADTDPATTSTAAEEPDASNDADQWARVDLGFVSAYVLVRGSEIAVVDTGTAGSAEAIGQTISDLGFNYSDVKHVALTHFHGDHAGSIGAVLEAAGNATAYAGTLDVERIDADLVAVSDGDDILGMQVIETPGHTPGHIALWDQLTSTLVAGDAMNGTDGGVSGANPRFTPDMATAAESIKRMSELEFDTVYFGHGEPIVGSASVAVKDLAEQL